MSIRVNPAMPVELPPSSGSVTNSSVANEAAIAFTKLHQTLVGFYGKTPIAQPAAYTQTYSATTRASAANALSTNVSISLLTDVPAIINTTNTAVNEVRQLVNSLIDDLQSLGLVQ